MTRFTKSSLTRHLGRLGIGDTYIKNANRMRLVVIGITGVTVWFLLSNMFSSTSSYYNSMTMGTTKQPSSSSSSSSSSSMLFDPSPPNSRNENSTSHIVQQSSPSTKKGDDKRIQEIVSRVFNEDPDEKIELRNHEVFPTTYNVNTQKEIYHHYKKGKRSGEVIEDILMCHAYAFHINATYGGSCDDPHETMVIHSNLLDSLGLKDKMPFACPRDKNLKDGIRRSTVSLSKCKQHDTRIFTPEYVNYLRSLVSLPSPTTNDDGVFTIAVHLNRRRQITPCSKYKHEGFDRYLPNLHFMNVINKYIKPEGENTKVLIFSQEESYEPLDDFAAKGYEVSYETDLSRIWHAFVTSDVLILSRSDFSMIPALVAQGKVVYTPSWHAPLKGWEVVDKEIMDMTDAETVRLRVGCIENST